eukprot:TRINITY_DN1376_c0_g1_i20.p2 TRINITY_DN1376_c0_g1~~TRINITY_DN1376_c0_g1_i20.p2  ORF type:complete len:239 (-),score=27.57 TRINITY_DN1376_c0_g1_i20:1095-1811(-)
MLQRRFSERIGNLYNSFLNQQVQCYGSAPLAHIWDIPISNRDGPERAETRQRGKAEWPIIDGDKTRMVEAYEVIGQKFYPQQAEQFLKEQFERRAQVAHVEDCLSRLTNSQFVFRNKQIKSYLVRNQEDRSIFHATGYIYSAEFIVKEVVKRLEAPRPAPPRKLIQQVMKDAAAAEGIKGCQIEIKGALGKKGMRSAKMVKQWGKYPFSTYHEKIDWSLAVAVTPKGLIGVQAFVTYD